MIRRATRPAPDDGLRSTTEAAAALNTTSRRLHRLVDNHYLTPAGTPSGPGSRTRWSEADIVEAGRILARADWGMTYEAAVRTIDPPLPEERDLLADLGARIERGMADLERAAADQYDDRPRRNRTLGKVAGLALVADWLRSYNEVA